MSANSEGKGILEISIAKDVTVKTWNNALSDISDRTLIAPDSALFQAASRMKVGDTVYFSGSFKPIESGFLLCGVVSRRERQGLTQHIELLLFFWLFPQTCWTGLGDPVALCPSRRIEALKFVVHFVGDLQRAGYHADAADTSTEVATLEQLRERLAQALTGEIT